jgi:hypothetical protein
MSTSIRALIAACDEDDIKAMTDEDILAMDAGAIYAAEREDEEDGGDEGGEPPAEGDAPAEGEGGEGEPPAEVQNGEGGEGEAGDAGAENVADDNQASAAEDVAAVAETRQMLVEEREALHVRMTEIDALIRQMDAAAVATVHEAMSPPAITEDSGEPEPIQAEEGMSDEEKVQARRAALLRAVKRAA